MPKNTRVYSIAYIIYGIEGIIGLITICIGRIYSTNMNYIITKYYYSIRFGNYSTYNSGLNNFKWFTNW